MTVTLLKFSQKILKSSKISSRTMTSLFQMPLIRRHVSIFKFCEISNVSRYSAFNMWLVRCFLTTLGKLLLRKMIRSFVGGLCQNSVKNFWLLWILLMLLLWRFCKDEIINGWTYLSSSRFLRNKIWKVQVWLFLIFYT